MLAFFRASGAIRRELQLVLEGPILGPLASRIGGIGSHRRHADNVASQTTASDAHSLASSALDHLVSGVGSVLSRVRCLPALSRADAGPTLGDFSGSIERGHPIVVRGWQREQKRRARDGNLEPVRKS